MTTGGRRCLKWFLGSTAVLIATLVVGASAQAVVGGAPADAGQWPWMAAVLDRSEAGGPAWQQYCGGVVIGPRRVLTAAHCAVDMDPSMVTILLGQTRLSGSGGRKIRVTSIRVHPRWVDESAPNLDAAVMTLASNAGVEPLPLAAAGDVGLWPPGTSAWTLGWGQLNARPSPSDNVFYADRLRQLQEPVQGDDACEGVYGIGFEGFPYQSQRVICAGTATGASGTCFGDSGGPLVVAGPSGWLDIGIVVGNAGCAARNYFDLYVRADAIRSFALATKPAAQPALVTPPRVVGRLKRGKVVRCAGDRWRGRVVSVAVRWTRVGDRGRARGHGRRHRVSAGDARTGLHCSVTARSRGGYLTASSGRPHISAPNRPGR